MRNSLQKWILGIGIVAYAFLGFSPFAGVAQMMPGMDADMHGAKQMHHEVMATTGECSTGCIDTAAVMDLDCLEHCMAAASDYQEPLATILLLSFFLAAVVAVVVYLFSSRSQSIRPDYLCWRFRPLYIFNTVRLLE